MSRAAHAVESKAVVRIEVAVSPRPCYIFFFVVSRKKKTKKKKMEKKKEEEEEKSTADVLYMWYYRPRGRRTRRATPSYPSFFAGTTYIYIFWLYLLKIFQYITKLF
jgi:hypothetical protein